MPLIFLWRMYDILSNSTAILLGSLKNWIRKIKLMLCLYVSLYYIKKINNKNHWHSYYYQSSQFYLVNITSAGTFPIGIASDLNSNRIRKCIVIFAEHWNTYRSCPKSNSSNFCTRRLQLLSYQCFSSVNKVENLYFRLCCGKNYWTL